MNYEKYELPDVDEYYNPNKNYVAKRKISETELKHDVYVQIKEAYIYKNIVSERTNKYLSLDDALISWVGLYGKEWRNRKNYERFYKRPNF